ncbi:unnamed protein product [Dibothriocephalus latus]|uniref:Major facilitator superfamily (MFS) profile domain-containing protein n=1 Tax=Dibothriocephalus latus TaxID=60516 RepID=A0A3P7LE78_DIBLA|nr:unnamed protein product [Dibothriocephalus latus]
MALSYDEVLERVYGTGLYQIVLTICCSMCSMMMSYEYQSMIFLHYTPSFNCSDSRMQDFFNLRWISSSTFVALFNDPSGMERMSGIETVEEQCWAIGQRNSSTHMELFSCSEWHFDQSVMRRTLSTDFTLICGRKHLIKWLASSMFFFIAVGHAIALFTDRISRRKLLLFYVVAEMIVTSTIQFGTYFEVIFILRLLRMLTMPLNFVATCIIQEILPTRKRGLFGTLYWIPYLLGYVGSAGLAYLTRDWYWFRIYALPLMISYLPVFFIMPESLRWLSANGEYMKFRNVLRRIARWNRVKLAEDFIEEAVTSIIGSETHKKVPHDQTDVANAGDKTEVDSLAITDEIKNVFRLPNMRKKTFILCIYVASMHLSFYGLTTSQNFASTNIFLNVLCMGLGELPAPFIGWAVAHFFCRRLSVGILAVVIASTVVIGPAVRPLSDVACTVIVFLGKVATSSTVSLSLLMVTEIMPTTIRNMGIFLTLSFSCTVSCLAPFINATDAIHYCLPGVIYGSVIVLGALLTLIFIPETKRCPLAQRLYQAEKLIHGKEEEWIEFMQKE